MKPILETLKLHGESAYAVYYEDTDLSGFVYHANYLKYFERAREDLIGVKVLKKIKEQEGVHFVVTEIECQYLSPASHSDIINVISDVEITRSPAHTYHQNAFVGDRKVVEAKIKIVALNRDNRPTRMPKEFIANLSALSTVG